jgi:hypothetical protein
MLTLSAVNKIGVQVVGVSSAEERDEEESGNRA